MILLDEEVEFSLHFLAKIWSNSVRGPIWYTAWKVINLTKRKKMTVIK